MRTLGQADLRQQRIRQRLGLAFTCPTHAQRAKHHVFQRRQMREEVELLEHHAGFLTDQALVDLRIVDLQTVDDQIATGDLFQLVDAAQQRRLTGAGRANDDHHFALGDVQVDVMQHLGFTKVLGDVFKFNHRIFILLSRRRKIKLSTRVMMR